MEVSTEAAPLYEWTITVQRYNFYGEIQAKTPMTIYAATKTEVTEKMRQAFEAEYNNFHKRWSHRWVLESVTEVREPEGRKG